MTRIPVRPKMLRWAYERADIRNFESFHKRFPKFGEWETEVTQPTLKQLEAFAKRVHVPIGYLFLPEPPEETLPILDFRTFDGRKMERVSPNLLDTLHTCQERLYWYQDFAQATDMPEAAFVGSAKLSDPPQDVAAQMAKVLNFDLAARASCNTWLDALRLFIAQADSSGILVMVSGIVRSHTGRTLDLEEFRGFALADKHAPLVFINGTDTKSGQMFTLAHELAHLWLGSSAVSNVSAVPLTTDYRREEIWCNAVAAELLVPLAELKFAIQPGELPEQAIQRLARQFKVSTLVILRRLLDVGVLDQSEFDRRWANELARLLELSRKKTTKGGNFTNTTLSRVGRRFARALVESTLEGQTLYRDAFRMLGVRQTKAFDTIAENVGFMG